MGIDIGYLLFLQNLRNATGGVFDEFFNAISKVAVSTMELLPFLVFWGISTYWGYRFFAGRWVGEVVNGLVKLTVCAYRPWIAPLYFTGRQQSGNIKSGAGSQSSAV